MSQDILNSIEAACLQENPPQFEIGDTVDVHTKILEGEKERIQIFFRRCHRPQRLGQPRDVHRPPHRRR